MKLPTSTLRPLRRGSHHLRHRPQTHPAITLCLRRSYSSSSGSLVRSEQRPAPHVGHIQILSLDRPDARNAISRRLLADLRAEVDALSCSPTGLRALIIASNVDGVFCAGADLKERATFSLDETRDFLTQLRSLLTTLSALPIPTISAINGAALGGGLELALTTTFRVASASARLGLPETRLGIVPGAGGTRRLPALVGRQRALNLVLTGRVVAALDAEGWGLVDRLVVPRGGEAEGEVRRRTVDEAVALAEAVCAGGPVAVVEALKAVRAWEDDERAEVEAYEVVLQTEDRLEALRAFREKRAPKFVGK